MEFSRGAIQFYDKDKNMISSSNLFWGTTYTKGETKKIYKLVPDEAVFFRINFRWFEYLEEDGETYTKINMYNEFYDYIYDLQVELSDTTDATDYEQHQEQTYENVAEAEITTYDNITYIYNTDYVEMSAEVRIKS